MTAASTLGIIGDGATDCAPAFRAALAPGVKIEFGPGVYMFGSQVELPSGADIRGCGLGTQFSPLPGFTPRTHLTNALLSTLPDTQGIRVSDLFLDGLAIGTESTASRICGLVMGRSTGWVVRHVTSGQWSGYAHWARGDGPLGNEAPLCSGIYEDCTAYDSNVLFEQSKCDGVELWRCKGHDGRRRIMIEAAFHQLSGASNILLDGCSFTGRAGGGINSLLNGYDMTGLVFRRVKIEMQSNSPALVAGPNPPDPNARIGMTIEDSNLSAPLANGANFTGVNLTARRSFIRGYSVGIGTGNNSTLLLEDTEVSSNNYPHATAYTQALYLGGNSVTTVTRGALRTRGVNPRPFAKETPATLNLSPQTIIETVAQPA